MGTKATLAKKMYVEGKNVSEIATALGIARATVYNYKKKDVERGVDWDDLAFSKAIDPSGVRLNEKEFLTTLIHNFEKALKGLDAIEDPEKKLRLLNEYARSYYKLKAPLKNDCKSAIIDALTKAVFSLSQLALEEDNKPVLEFLSAHETQIIEMVLRK